MKIKISQVDLLRLRIPLITPFVSSQGREDVLDHILVRIRTPDLTGYGECPVLSSPYYLEETPETCFHILKDFIVPSFLNQSFETVEAFIRSYEWIQGNRFAKAGAEMAFWDLLSQVRQTSIASLLGGTRSHIESGVSLGVQANLQLLIEQITTVQAQGYRRVKIKIAPGKDLEILKAIRNQFPSLPLMVDANSSYTWNDLSRLKALDEFDLMMIEQPLQGNDFIEHAQLQSLISTPICLDESILSLNDARLALHLGSCKIINIKPSRVGGLLEAKKIHDFCFERGLPVWCGGMHEFGIGRAHAVALSSLPGFSLPGDISGSNKYFHQDIIDPPITMTQGKISVPTSPGLGFKPNESLIQKYTVQEMSFFS